MELSASPVIGRRILALWFARLPTDRLQRQRRASPDDPPLVLSIKSNNARILYAVDLKAARLKLTPGMPLASARAMVRELAVVEADEPADAKLLAGIADWCDRFTPFVAIDGADGLLLDVTGATHLFGGEAAMLGIVRTAIARQGFAVRAALAGTAVAARALARYADATIAAPGTEAEAVAFLPVAALDLDSRDTHALRRAGLKTIGQVAGRTRAELTARFGKEMVFKLDRALGRSEKPISPRRILPDYMAEHRFAEPVTTEDFIADSILSLAGIAVRSSGGTRPGRARAGSQLLSRRRRGPPHRGRNGAALARSQDHRAAVPRPAGCAGRSARSRLRLRPDPAWRRACRASGARKHRARCQAAMTKRRSPS